VLSRSLGGALGVALALWASPSRADDDDPHPFAPSRGNRPEVTLPHGKIAAQDELDYETPRFEIAAFPLIGGDSDIGFEFGGVGTLTRFADGTRPYSWNMDLLLATSVKQGPHGAEFTQQSYLWQLDAPRLVGSSVRLNPAVSYSDTINQGYFGIGNASSANPPARVHGEPGRYFQYDEREGRLRELTRIGWRRPWDFLLATTLRHAAPVAYRGSKLAEDVALGNVRGYRDMTLAVLGFGFLYDTRDNEFFPRRGAFHQIGIRGVQGFPFDAHVDYAALGVVLAEYVPVGGPVIFAVRGLVDAQFGHVPFFDLYTGGPFITYEMIGGAEAVRGVPDGRYLGKLKAIANVELRAMLVDFRLLGQAFHFGSDLLFDAGRLWSDYTFHALADGPPPGIKWGAGGGIYLIWGQAAVFRIEAAYSPDAVSENPQLPLGIYVSDGVMF
jgi:Omp85 superfamily domain